MSLTFFIKQIEDTVCSLSKFSYVRVASFVDFNISVVCCDGMPCGLGSKFIYLFIYCCCCEVSLKVVGFSAMYRNKDRNCLYTCAVRPAAIYGPGEERHLPRIVSLAKKGLLPFKIGEASVKTDWVYVDNLVLALILASMGLLDDIPGKEKHPIAAGQPYFVSDGK
jgi:hypothetical protein